MIRLVMLCIGSLSGFANANEARPPHPGGFWGALSHTFSRRASRNVPDEGYYDPSKDGGRMLTTVYGTFPEGLGEPLNIIISGHSDQDVLVHQEANGGLLNYFISTGFSGECLGQTSGARQAANLGDGNGTKNQTSIMRWNYGDPELGACKESIQGGNHFRYWIQDGPKGNSGAVFLAASAEKPIAQLHDIVVNGYNLGRDEMIGNITGTAIPTFQLTSTSEYSGTTSYGGYTYETKIKYVSGLLANSSVGINHYLTVGVEGKFNAVDGLVAIFTVSITDRPKTTNNASPLSISRLSWILCAISILSLLS